MTLATLARIAGRKNITMNLPVTVFCAKYKQFIVAFVHYFIVGTNRRFTRRTGAGVSQITECLNFLDRELDVELDGVKHLLVGCTHLISTDLGWRMLRHKYWIFAV